MNIRGIPRYVLHHAEENGVDFLAIYYHYCELISQNSHIEYVA
jgi:hypothetical protein